MSTPLAPTLEAFFTDRLLCQQRVSPNTIASYRDTFRLLLGFLKQQTGTRPARLQLTQLDAPAIGAFLEHLETERGNSARTRNVRLAAVHSLFNYCALRHPEHAALIARVLAIPAKRSDKRIVTFLHPEEVKALLVTAVQTGLRVSELLALTCSDVQLGAGPHLRTIGKGRIGARHPADQPDRRRAQRLDPRTPRPTSRPAVPDTHPTAADPHAIERRLARHLTAAQRTCPTLRSKRVSMHVLRHTAAMMLLNAGIDTSTIALRLGHEQERTTHVYLHADLALKQRALDRTTPPNSRPGRYQAPDTLLGFLDSL